MTDRERALCDRIEDLEHLLIVATDELSALRRQRDAARGALEQLEGALR